MLQRLREVERENLGRSDKSEKGGLCSLLPPLSKYNGKTSWKVFQRLFKTYVEVKQCSEMEMRIMLNVHMQDEAALFLDWVKDKSLSNI